MTTHTITAVYTFADITYSYEMLETIKGNPGLIAIIDNSTGDYIWTI